MYWSRNVEVAAENVVSPPRSKLPRRLRLYMGLMALDCLCILFAFTVAAALSSPEYISLHGVNIAAMALPIYLGIAINGRAYGLHVIKRPGEATLNALITMGITTLALTTVLYFAHVGADISRLSFFAGVSLAALLVSGIRWPYAHFAKRLMDGALTNEIVIMDDVVVPTKPGAHVVDAHASNLTPDLHDPFMLDRLGRWLRCFDRAVVACPPERREVWSRLLKGANIQGEIIVPECNLADVVGIGRYQGHDTQIVSRGPLALTLRAKKRAFDLVLTVPTLIMLTPLLIVIAIAIKLESKGPVLFVQNRVGRSNTLFNIYKFRSMRVEQCDAAGNRSASRDDDRITRVGRFIRRTSLDELPQLFNVLLGDMSLVGPRPHALGSTAGTKPFWEVNPLYWCRHSLKPGITGLAQIRGFRGATDTEADLENRLRADLEYIAKWSLEQELLILLGTFRVLVHKNAY